MRARREPPRFLQAFRRPMTLQSSGAPCRGHALDVRLPLARRQPLMSHRRSSILYAVAYAATRQAIEIIRLHAHSMVLGAEHLR